LRRDVTIERELRLTSQPRSVRSVRSAVSPQYNIERFVSAKVLGRALARRHEPSERPRLTLIVALATPFIAIGVWLTLRRLRSKRLTFLAAVSLCLVLIGALRRASRSMLDPSTRTRPVLLQRSKNNQGAAAFSDKNKWQVTELAHLSAPAREMPALRGSTRAWPDARAGSSAPQTAPAPAPRATNPARSPAPRTFEA